MLPACGSQITCSPVMGFLLREENSASHTTEGRRGTLFPVVDPAVSTGLKKPRAEMSVIVYLMSVRSKVIRAEMSVIVLFYVCLQQGDTGRNVSHCFILCLFTARRYGQKCQSLFYVCSQKGDIRPTTAKQKQRNISKCQYSDRVIMCFVRFGFRPGPPSSVAYFMSSGSSNLMTVALVLFVP